MKSKLVFLEEVALEKSPMVRADLRPEVIEEYAAIYRRDKHRLPPIELFLNKDDKHYLVGDGMHRLQAMRSLTFKAAQCNVHEGGFEDALKFALMANEAHGIRRSQADKRRCIEEAIKQWPKCSNVQIAKLAAVDDHTVKSVRDWLESQGVVKEEPIREGRDGKKRAASRETSESRGSNAPKKLDAKCKTGAVLTTLALKFWERTDEVKEVIGQVVQLERILKKIQSVEDLMFCEVNISAALADLDKIMTNLETAIPYALCPQCQGQPKSQPNGECRMCKGRAVVSQFRWRTVPAELRRLRETQK